ncbi:Uncharacterised protein [Pseudomonas aeruginosa]|nr:Uncharacterised protein [Pseudomonas aeruginosa]
MRGVLGQSPEAHLQGLFGYACEAYKLLVRYAVYDPFWSLIIQDVKVQVEADPLIERVEYRRYHKTTMGFSGKNCEMFLGQFICLIARERIPAKKAIESAHRLEFWHVIEDHYLAKGWTRRELEQYIKHLISDRYSGEAMPSDEHHQAPGRPLVR